jgi:hypothetical protein
MGFCTHGSRLYPAACLLVLATAGVPDSQAEGLLPSLRARAPTIEQVRPAGVPSDAELEAAEATIGEILIEPQPIFDAEEADDEARAFRAANRLHAQTRPETIASQLLFHTGDRYSADRLAETERGLRKDRYLYDARVVPVAYRDGRVDVLVRTRDVWTLNPGVSFGRSGGVNSSSVEIEEMNLLGTGRQLSLGYSMDHHRSGTALRYRDPHVGDSWWRLAAGYADSSDGGSWQLDLERPFYALTATRAGGLSLLEDDRVDQHYDRGVAVDEYRARRRLATAYAGRSAGLSEGWSRRWTAGVTADESRFEPTADTEDAALVPVDRDLVYPWIGLEILENRYEKRSNRDQIGRIEDVALGWHAGVQLGWADRGFGSDRDALMFRGEAARGFDIGLDDSLQLGATLGGRLQGGGLAGTVLGGGARLHHLQSPARGLYVSMQADVGHNLDADAPLELGGDNGLRGYPLRYTAGEGRWLFTAEQRWFTDWYPLRLVHVGAAAFFDAGGTWGENPGGSPPIGLLRDVGVGLRFGMSRSALANVLHVDLAMPLDGGSDVSNLQLLVATKASF